MIQDRQSSLESCSSINKMFWQCFIREYLPTLQIRERSNKVQHSMKKNDLAIVREETPENNIGH